MPMAGMVAVARCSVPSQYVSSVAVMSSRPYDCSVSPYETEKNMLCLGSSFERIHATSVSFAPAGRSKSTCGSIDTNEAPPLSRSALADAPL